MLLVTGDSRKVRSKIVDDVRRSKLNTSTASVKGTPLYLRLYNTPPEENITLIDFDDIAVERLKVLKALEMCKDNHKFNDDDFKRKFRDQTGKFRRLILAPGQADGVDPKEIAAAWNRDTIGHFILRLAFCRSPENTKWLVNLEVDLFRYRFLNERRDVILNSLRDSNFKLDTVSPSEREKIATKLAKGSGMTLDQVSVTDFWKVDFTEALDLVRKQQVYLKDGLAYVPFGDLVVIMCSHLRIQMTAAMARAYKHLAILEEEGRLLPRLARLANNAYSGKEYNGTENTDQITRQMIDGLCAASFPPCMKQIHGHLRTNHHLKYGARRQYGLFLKAIGLSLDEAMMFMREEFTKKIPSDKFEKEYAYNIRYMYGKEGKRVAQTAMSCPSIILRNPPSAADCHGCPFRHTEAPILAQRLQKEGFTKEQIQTIVNLSQQNAYDKACTRFFELKHHMDEGALGSVIAHPNQYFEQSQNVLSGKKSTEAHIVEAHFSQSQSARSTQSTQNTAPVPMDEDFDF